MFCSFAAVATSEYQAEIVSMKPPAKQLIGAFFIAAVFGSGGYFFGSSHVLREVGASKPALQKLQETGATTSRRQNRSDTDWEEFVKSLNVETNPLVRFKSALENMEEWVNRDARGALAWLTSQEPSQRRDEVLQLVLGQYAETDPKGAAGWMLENLTGDELNNNVILLAEKWAERNGVEAASWFVGRPDGAERDAALETILFGWASNEPGAALDFIRANETLGKLTPMLQRAALAGWANTDPVAAVKASLGLSQAAQDPAQFANTLANWATVDLAASSDWLRKNVPDGPEKSEATRELAAVFAQQSPKAGVAWLDQIPAGPDRDVAASSLLAAWSRNGPAESTQWAVTQQSSSLTPEAVEISMRSYFRKDQAGFERWRSGLSPGPFKLQADQIGRVANSGN